MKVTSAKWVKTSAQIAKMREELASEQGGLDPILNEPLKKPCLDHDHFTGRVRGVLSQCTNTFEGYVLKAWMKYVSSYTNTSLSDALRNLADYIEGDHRLNAIHGSYLSDMTKFLKRLTNETIKLRAEKDLGLIIPESCNKTESIHKYLDEFIRQTEDYNYGAIEVSDVIDQIREEKCVE